MAGSVIAVGNLKGGSSKTTIAVNLASALSASGSVTLVDADEQATASAWGEAGNLPRGVLLKPLPLPVSSDKTIKAWISQVVTFRADAAYVVIDLPPNLGSVTSSALMLADLFVIPVPPSGMDIRATGTALTLVREARKMRGAGKPEVLLVPAKVDRRTGAGREIEAVLSDFREPVAPAVSLRAAHVDAFGAGRWIGEYAPRSAGHVEIEAVAAVVKRMVSR